MLNTHMQTLKQEEREKIEKMDIKEGEIDIHYDKSSQNVFSVRH